MTTITKKEWLDFLHLLHNKLRNSEGVKLTGMSALTEINNFMMFRFLDDCDKFGFDLPENYKCKNLYLKYATDKKIEEDKRITHNKDMNRTKLWESIYDFSGNDDSLLSLYFSHCDLRKYLLSSVDRISAYTTEKNSMITIQNIINIIYKKFKNITFDSKFFDMFGSAYEEFKTNACGNSGKHTGQHFTNVFIKKIIINELKPKHNEIFYEPCAGSGGFVHTADHYVHENEGYDKSKLFKKNIYANECNLEIFRPLIMNMMFHNIPVDNIHQNDSLDTCNIKKMLNKVNIIATNYPFGMSNVIKGDIYVNGKPFDYWKVLKNGKNFVKNSSAQFIIHIHHSLVNGGRTGFVSDRGILNNGCSKKNSWETRLRKFMFEENNVYKIIFLPTGAFTYTNFQTCIIFMTKGGSTQECKLYDAKFRDPKDKTSEIYVEVVPLKTFKIEELRENNYSIKLEEKVEEIKEGWVKLGDICKIKCGKFNSNNMDNKGAIPFYSCTSINPIGTHSIHSFDFPLYILFIGSGGSSNKVCGPTIGMGKSYLVNGKTACRSNIYAIYDSQYELKYINYVLQLFTHNICSKAKFSGNLGVISLKTMQDIKIPNISLQHQQEIVELLDVQFKNYDITLLSQFTKDIDLFKLLIHKKYDEFNNVLYLLYRKIEMETLNNHYELDKKSIFDIKMNTFDVEYYQLNDIVNISKGSFNTRDIDNSGTCKSDDLHEAKDSYPYYNSGYKNPCGNHSKYDCNFNECILFVKDGGDKTNPLNENTGMGKPFYVKGKVAVMSHVLIFTNSKEDLYNLKYLYYYLEYNRKKIMRYAKYNSGLGSISMEIIKKYVIPIPTIENQLKLINIIEKIQNEQIQFKNYAENLQNNINQIPTMINKISSKKNINNNDSINNNTDSDNSNVSDNNVDNDAVNNGDNDNDSDNDSDNDKDNNNDNSDSDSIFTDSDNDDNNTTEYTMNDICEIIENGIKDTDIKQKKDKIYKIPYYSSDNLQYCKKAMYSSKCILCVKTTNNQGNVFIVDGNFCASSDMIVIKLEKEFEEYYDQVLDELQNNFDYEKMIKESPVKVKTSKGVNALKIIGVKHIKEFKLSFKK